MMSSDFVAKFVQDQTQLVNVLALVDLYVDMLRWSCTLYEVSFNFRCHVSLSSCNRREFELAFLDAPEWDSVHFVMVLRFYFLASRIKHSGETEVTNFGSISMTINIDENILWLQISMQHIVFVDFSDTVDHVPEDFYVLWSIDNPTFFMYIGRFTFRISFGKEVFQWLSRAILHLNHHVNRVEILIFLQKVAKGTLGELWVAWNRWAIRWLLMVRFHEFFNKSGGLSTELWRLNGCRGFTQWTFVIWWGYANRIIFATTWFLTARLFFGWWFILNLLKLVSRHRSLLVHLFAVGSLNGVW